MELFLQTCFEELITAVQQLPLSPEDKMRIIDLVLKENSDESA